MICSRGWFYLNEQLYLFNPVSSIHVDMHESVQNTGCNVYRNRLDKFKHGIVNQWYIKKKTNKTKNT